MQEPAISILMPVRNGMPFLELAITSILTQDFDNFECIVIDDASSDDTYAFLESIGDRRLRIFRNERNLGVTDTLIKGWQLCRADLIARMDADDVSMPSRLGKQKQIFDVMPDLCVLGTGANAFGDREFLWKAPERHEELRAYLMFDCVFPHCSVMMRRSRMEKLGLLYRPEFRQAQDYDLWSRTSIKGLLAGINEPLVKYRFHEKAITAQSSEDQRQNADRIRRYKLENDIGYMLQEEDVIPMRQLAGVYAHRFAKTAAELRATGALKDRLLEHARSAPSGPFFMGEIETRWKRTLGWASPEAKAELGYL